MNEQRVFSDNRISIEPNPIQPNQTTPNTVHTNIPFSVWYSQQKSIEYTNLSESVHFAQNVIRWNT